MNNNEVGVVVGIVVFVVGTLVFSALPALNKQKAKSSSDPCTMNLKQLGYAGALYEGDNKGNRPGPQPLGIGIPSVSWDRPLAIQMGIDLGPAGICEPLASMTMVPACPAAKKLAIFACPVDPQAKGARAIPETPGSLADGMAPGSGICRSYVMNLGSGNLVAGINDGIAATADAIPIKKIESSCATVYLVESRGYATVFGQRNLANDTYLTCDQETGILAPRDAISNPKTMHGPKNPKNRPQVNVLMYDGHVEAIDQAIITADHGKLMQYGKKVNRE